MQAILCSERACLSDSSALIFGTIIRLYSATECPMTPSKAPSTEVEALAQILTVLKAMEEHMKNISFQMNQIVPKLK
jgi:hypothetical protein